MFTDVDFLPSTAFYQETAEVDCSTPTRQQCEESGSIVERHPLIQNKQQTTEAGAFPRQPLTLRPFPKKAVTSKKRTQRKKAESGYLNSTPSLKKRRPATYSSSSSENDEVFSLDDSSGDEAESPLANELPVELSDEIRVEVGKYYVVKFDNKKTTVFYVQNCQHWSW